MPWYKWQKNVYQNSKSPLLYNKIQTSWVLILAEIYKKYYVLLFIYFIYNYF